MNILKSIKDITTYLRVIFLIICSLVLPGVVGFIFYYYQTWWGVYTFGLLSGYRILVINSELYQYSSEKKYDMGAFFILITFAVCVFACYHIKYSMWVGLSIGLCFAQIIASILDFIGDEFVNLLESLDDDITIFILFISTLGIVCYFDGILWLFYICGLLATCSVFFNIIFPPSKFKIIKIILVACCWCAIKYQLSISIIKSVILGSCFIEFVINLLYLIINIVKKSRK